MEDNNEANNTDPQDELYDLIHRDVREIYGE